MLVQVGVAGGLDGVAMDSRNRPWLGGREGDGLGSLDAAGWYNATQLATADNDSQGLFDFGGGLLAMVRDGDALHTVVPHTARQFGRAIIMPNLKPPVTTVQQALAYRERVLAAVPDGSGFTPLMTLYLTDNTSPAEIFKARDSGFVVLLTDGAGNISLTGRPPASTPSRWNWPSGPI